ncbi:MAG: MCE family protein [Xanthomonadales bacterium]|nr:MCE family protein [Xanthomonadales bacterium]
MNNKNFAVGLFVALALAGFVSATIWLTGKQGSEPTKNYSMFFEKDVSGLMLGGPVFYLGVEVGSVIAMTIIPGDPMQVRVDARVLKSAPVDQGTYASLAFQGITGVAVVKLNADPGSFDPLHVEEGNQFPVITVRDTGFSALLAKAPNVVDKLDSILEQINQILGPENREFVSIVLGDLSKVSSALAAQEEAISKIPASLQQTIEELHSSLVQIKTMVSKLEPGLSTTLANLDQATGNLANMTERLDAWTATNDTEMNAFMEDGLGQVPALVADARATLREVEKLIKDLREDPSVLIYKPNEDDVDVDK